MKLYGHATPELRRNTFMDCIYFKMNSEVHANTLPLSSGYSVSIYWTGLVITQICETQGSHGHSVRKSIKECADFTNGIYWYPGQMEASALMNQRQVEIQSSNQVLQ